MYQVLGRLGSVEEKTLNRRKYLFLTPQKGFARAIPIVTLVLWSADEPASEGICVSLGDWCRDFP